MRQYGFVTLFIMLLFIVGCTTIPEGVESVYGFEKSRYLGLWYEIARFDFRFEEGLSHTTARYTLNEDGTIRVVNRGYDYEKEEWRQAEGKAKFVGAESQAMLKVSFFGPFYAGYNVIDLADDYRYALVCGDSREYLWILSRQPEISPEVKERFLGKAQAYGFDISELLWVDQSSPRPEE